MMMSSSYINRVGEFLIIVMPSELFKKYFIGVQRNNSLTAPFEWVRCHIPNFITFVHCQPSKHLSVRSRGKRDYFSIIPNCSTHRDKEAKATRVRTVFFFVSDKS